MGLTPDRRPGPLEEDEELRLGANAAPPSMAGALAFDGTNFAFRDSVGTFNPRTGGGISSTELFLETQPTTPGITYSNTYTSGRVSQEVWRRTADNSLLKQVDYTYTSGRVTGEVRRVYAADGTTVLGQQTWTYSYTAGQLSGATMVRNV